MQITKETLEQEINKEAVRLEQLVRARDDIGRQIEQAQGKIHGYRNMISHLECPDPVDEPEAKEEKPVDNDGDADADTE